MKALLAEVRVLQPDGGDDQKDGEDDHEEVEDEDAGEGRGQLVHHPRQAKMSSLSLASIDLNCQECLDSKYISKYISYILLKHDTWL